MHGEEDHAKLSIEKVPLNCFAAREIQFEFQPGSKSSEYRARAMFRSYRFRSVRGAKVVEVQPVWFAT